MRTYQHLLRTLLPILALLSLWGEADCVHMALLDEAQGTVGIISLDCPDRRYPSVGLHHPPAPADNRRHWLMKGIR